MGSPVVAEIDATAPGLLELSRLPVFRVLYLAETQSIAGDQLARVALSILVYDRTSSAVATAAAYAATFLPAVVGGLTLGRLGDRFPRRTVMIGCDVIRALIFGVMACVDMPPAALVGLVVAAVVVGPAFSAAQVGYLAQALSTEQFRAATGIRMITNQLAQVGGFALAGPLVALSSPRGALLVDAVTYLVSAVLITARLGRLGAPGVAGATSASGAPAPARVDGWRPGDVRRHVALLALAGFFVVPEGLAVPFGAGAGASAASIGLLFAAIPLGTALGTVLLIRAARPRWRLRWSYAMAVACGLPLVATALPGPWPVACAAWVLSGALAAYQIELSTALIRGVPDEFRSRFVGMVSAVLLGAQGAGVVLFGALAQVLAASTSIALSGAVGAVVALSLVWPLWPTGPDAVPAGASATQRVGSLTSLDAHAAPDIAS